MSGGGRIEGRHLSKWYGEQQVLFGIDLDIESGEFFSLLGPSGCGKTTTLRMIGGFEDIDEGTITIDGVDMRGVAPEKRPVNTVFQSYALFPHMTVADNVGFGLRFADVGKDERRRRVAEALDLVRMGEYAGRKPHQLSGGQQQRVGLARAVARRPNLLLLDEPLSALDTPTRNDLRGLLRTFLVTEQIPTVLVTHDPADVRALSDHVVVLEEGQILQAGPTADVLQFPASPQVQRLLAIP